jgi:hypothetical protein
MIQICTTSNWTGARFPTTPAGVNSAAKYAAQQDEAQVKGVYVRMTTLKDTTPMSKGERGSEEHSHTLPCLWADVDIAGPGHKHVPNIPGTEDYNTRKKTQLPLPPSVSAAKTILESCGLGQPTIVITSGGGFYPLWFLDTPEDLTDEYSMALARTTSQRLQELIRLAFERGGYHYGTEVSDLSRVLRIPGTHNRKVDGNPRPCVIEYHGGPVYDLMQLSGIVEEEISLLEESAPKTSQPETPNSTAPTQSVPSSEYKPIPTTSAGKPYEVGGTPMDEFENATPWEEILLPHGWLIHSDKHTGERCWTRPGKNVHDGLSATTGYANDRDRMFCFSSSAGLPTGEPMTKGYVYAQLNHGGDLSRAAKHLKDQGFGQIREELRPVATAAPLLPSQPTMVAEQQYLQQRQGPMGDHGWAPPLRFGHKKVSRDFPVECLPPTMGEYVRSAAASLQVPISAVATTVLATVSAFAAPRMRVERKDSGWSESLSLYVLNGLPSGERKSPLHKLVSDPIEVWEDQLRKAHAEKVEQQIVDMGDKRGVSGNPVAANRVEDALKDLEAEKKRPPRVQLSADATTEAFTMALERNGGHGTINDAEGAILGIFAGRYAPGKQPNIEIFLNGYGGERYSSTRVGRGDVFLANPNITMALSTQPSVVRDMCANHVLDHRGMLSRFIFCMPESLVGFRDVYDNRRVDPQLARAWELTLHGIGLMVDPSPVDESCKVMPTLVFEQQALAIFDNFRDKVEKSSGPNGDLSAIQAWVSKHSGRVMRIAALLHLANGGTLAEEIKSICMENAIRIGDWCLEQALSVLLAEGPEAEFMASQEQCEKIIRKFRKKGLQHVTNRELVRMMKEKWATKQVLADAMDQLAELGWVKLTAYVDRAGIQRQRYMVNPMDPYVPVGV